MSWGDWGVCLRMRWRFDKTHGSILIHIYQNLSHFVGCIFCLRFYDGVRAGPPTSTLCWESAANMVLINWLPVPLDSAAVAKADSISTLGRTWMLTMPSMIAKNRSPTSPWWHKMWPGAALMKVAAPNTCIKASWSKFFSSGVFLANLDGAPVNLKEPEINLTLGYLGHLGFQKPWPGFWSSQGLP